MTTPTPKAAATELFSIGFLCGHLQRMPADVFKLAADNGIRPALAIDNVVYFDGPGAADLARVARGEPRVGTLTTDPVVNLQS
jgi:hypothetical protein